MLVPGVIVENRSNQFYIENKFYLLEIKLVLPLYLFMQEIHMYIQTENG